jgi:hypothetical protein
MSTTIQDSINYAETFIQYSPLSAGLNFNPATTIANDIQNTMMNAPFIWPWNRNEYSELVLERGTQDYTVDLNDFGFLEKVTLIDPNSHDVFEIKDIYNNIARAVATTSNTQKYQRPNSACIIMVTYGTSLKLRFIGIPDKAYSTVLTYQKLVVPLTTLTGSTGTWVVPDSFTDVFNSLFVGEAMANVDDARAQQYRQRGIATLLAKAEGLTEMQVNAFLEQYWSREHQVQYRTQRTQMSGQAGGV